VKDFWFALVDNNLASVAKIDQDTVEKLQLRAPRVESRVVHGLVLSGQVFANFDENERVAIWDRLHLFNGLIPSLYSFFEDFKCFESWAYCLTRLFTLEKRTIRDTMCGLRIHSDDGDGTCLVQTSESTFSCRTEPVIRHFDLAYRQMWLYAMRHYPQMPRDPKRGNRLAKPQNATADECVVSGMACLARRLGFDSAEITDLINQSPDRLIARHALLRARKPDCFVYDDSVLNLLIDRIVDCFAMATPKDVEPPMPVFMQPSGKQKARCGNPTVRALLQDRPRLFLDHMHADEAPDTVTTFFVRRCVYLAFFGPRPTIPGDAIQSPSSTCDLPPGLPMSPLFESENSPMDNLFEEQDLQDDRRSHSADRSQRLIMATPAVNTEGGSADELRRLRTEVEQTNAAQLAAEQERIQREAEQRRRLQREADARAAAESAEQERLQRETQERLEREVKARADAELAAQQERERLQNEVKWREIAEQAAKRGGERLRREAEAVKWREIAEQAAKRGEERLRREAEARLQADERAAQQALLQEAAGGVEQALPQEYDGAAEQDREESHDVEFAETSEDENFDEILRPDAEQRSLADHDTQDRARWEAELSAPAAPQREVEEKGAAEPTEQDQLQTVVAVGAATEHQQKRNTQQEEERVAQERAMALARLQTGAEDHPFEPETEVLPAAASRRLTQFDLPGLLASWRDPGDQSDSGNEQRTPNTGRRTARKKQPRPAGIRKSRMKGRPTRQAANHEAGRVAAIYDHLGWELEGADSTDAGNTLTAQADAVQKEIGERSVAEPAAPAQSPQQQEAATADAARVRFDASAENDGLGYNPAAQYNPKGLTRSTLTDPGGDSTTVAADGPWPSQLSAPSIRTEKGQASGDGTIPITFLIYERDGWKPDKVLQVNPSDPTSLERAVWGYKRRDFFVYDVKMRTVSVPSSFRAATADGTNALLLISRNTRQQMDVRQPIEPPTNVGGQQSKRRRIG
jgi:hypothetical protein